MSRKLGQHFLINEAAVKKIIDALDLKSDETIIEIGPGTGALTIPLAEECQKLNCKILAIEKDPSLVTGLLGYLVTWKNISDIIQGDALKLIDQVTKQLSNWKLVGNIPYYITGKLLRIIGDLERKPELTVLTIQKEVAERIVAKTPKMNLLAAAIQIWAKAEIIGNLKPGDFDPPPEVDSAIIKLIPEQKLPKNELEKYYKIIKTLFKQPRKTVLNNLSTPGSRNSSMKKSRLKRELEFSLPDTGALHKSKQEWLKILQKVGLSEVERPQNLSLSQLLQLSRELE